jgi:putative tryptophan/tyrosine transport system substrate-binding protein
VLAVAFLPAALAAKTVTSTIPICFVTGADPVNQGLVASLNRPGGNVTGVAFFSALLGAKRLGLLHELVPAAGTFALLVNPNNANAESLTRDLQAAGHTLGKQILVLPASTEREIDRQFASLDQQQVGALIVAPDAFFDSQRDHIVELVARQAIPAIYERHEAATAGGLMSYEPTLPTRITKPASTPAGVSGARSRPTCRSCSRPSSSLSLTSGPPKRSTSQFRQACSPSPTR